MKKLQLLNFGCIVKTEKVTQNQGGATMLYVGIDFHKKYSYITVMDREGVIAREFKVSNDKEALTHYVNELPANAKVALEATCNWYYFYELVEGHDIDVSLAHPLKTKAIASARIMNDKISSATLARLLRSDLLPTAYLPDRETRDAREILRQRAFLVSVKTRLKNIVHAILSKNGILCPYTDIFRKKCLLWLQSLNLRPCTGERHGVITHRGSQGLIAQPVSNNILCREHL